MKFYLFFFISAFFIFFPGVSSIVDDYQPSQVHLSFGNNINEIVVTWITTSKTRESLVEYGVNGLTKRKEGNQTVFVDGGKEKRKFYIHRVVLFNLKENTTYEYHCGSNLGWSDRFRFHTPLFGNSWAPHFAIFGDLGAVNAQSLPRLQKEAQAGMYDAILHVGDMAYDMDSDNGRIGDEFMKQIEPIAAYVPYMTAVGNHEQKYNFSHYRLRFSMPGNTQGLFYSFNMGPIHFIVLSTEVYYFFIDYGIKPLINQFEWLKKDLKDLSESSRGGVIYLEARGNATSWPRLVTWNKRRIKDKPNLQECPCDGTIRENGEIPEGEGVTTETLSVSFVDKQLPSVVLLQEASAPENRTIRPWIITMGHRPMYCSNDDKDDCTYRSDYVRVGIFPFGKFGLEDLFYQHGVDIEIWAHEHSYERSWPLYDYKVYNGTTDPYVNPGAPIHIVTGSAGCNEYVDHFKTKVGDWSAFRSSDYGYTRLKVHNASHLHFEQVSDDKDGLIIDEFWVVKQHHGAYKKKNFPWKKFFSSVQYFVTKV